MIYDRYRPRTSLAPANVAPDLTKPPAEVIVGTPSTRDPRPRKERAWLLDGLAQWLEAGREARAFWSSPLVMGLRPPPRARLTDASSHPDPLLVLATAGYLTAHGLQLARDGESAGRLPETLRLIATADRQQEALHSTWLSWLAFPMFVAGMLALSGEIAPVMMGLGATAALGFGVGLVASAAVLLVVLSRSRTDQTIDRLLRGAMAGLPIVGAGYRWRAQEAVLDVLAFGEAHSLPVTLVVRAARLAGAHPTLARHADAVDPTDRAMSAVSALAPWFAPKDRATLLHAQQLDRVQEAVPPLKADRARSAALAHRVAAGMIVGLTVLGSTLLAVIRLTEALYRYAAGLGIH